jgi:hypothetical protein
MLSLQRLKRMILPGSSFVGALPMPMRGTKTVGEVEHVLNINENVTVMAANVLEERRCLPDCDMEEDEAAFCFCSQ